MPMTFSTENRLPWPTRANEGIDWAWAPGCENRQVAARAVGPVVAVKKLLVI